MQMEMCRNICTVAEMSFHDGLKLLIKSNDIGKKTFVYPSDVKISRRF